LSVGLGAVYLEDMLPEVAYAKAMVALKEKNPVDFMRQNVAGEITSSEDPRTFLL
jgi:L-asparaginase/Glu-tRNA(Gln) amidotransferase subunit D